MQAVEVIPSYDFSLAYAQSEEDFRAILEEAKILEYIAYGNDLVFAFGDEHRVTSVQQQIFGAKINLRPAGWIRLQEIRQFEPESNQASVAMWFNGEVSETWENGLRAGTGDAGYDPVRIDGREHNNKICDEIIAEIRKSRFVVCDFTGHRGGVYFEAGFAMGLGLPVIWTCREDAIKDAHFDTRQYNHITWKTPEDLREKLKNRIEATIPKKTN